MSAAGDPPGPRYVARGGDLTLAQPIQNDRVRSYTWLCDADWHALEATCRRAFDLPSGGAVQVRPLLPVVAVICADIARGQSLVPPDRDKGWARERDLGFWVPVARGRRDGDHFHIDQIGWYQPYLFVDNAAGVVTGRETYGFQKSYATCRMPSRPGDSPTFAVDTLIIRNFSPDSQAEVAELYRIEPEDEDGRGFAALESTFDNLLEALIKVETRLLLRGIGHGGLPIPTLTLAKNLYQQLTQGLVPMLFLKQFRSVEDPAIACYQAIVEAACDLDGWHGGGFLDSHRLTIAHADSHPIAADLGLGTGPIATGWGFWAEYDFKVAPGRVLWQAK